MTDQIKSQMQEENRILKLQLTEEKEKHKMEIAMISKEYEKKITFLQKWIREQKKYYNYRQQLNDRQELEDASCIIA